MNDSEEQSHNKDFQEQVKDFNESTERFLIKSFEHLKLETSELLSHAKRTVQLYTKDLDPRVLGQREIEHRLTQFIKRSRASKLQMLIYDEALMKGNDHRLISLAQRFTSYVEIRVIPRDYHESYFGFYLVDSKQLIYRNNFERFEAEVAKLPNSLVKEKSKWFESVWQMSSPASFLRALYL